MFDRIARAVCAAGCLPRKELYEAWETARRTRRLFRGGRVVDVGGGHGLLALLLVLLDDTSASAVVVDPHIPPSSPSVALFKDGAVVDFLPRLRIEGRSAIDVERDLVAMFEKHFAAK